MDEILLKYVGLENTQENRDKIFIDLLKYFESRTSWVVVCDETNNSSKDIADNLINVTIIENKL